MRIVGILFSILLVMVSPATAQDLIYSGELSTDSGYTSVKEEGIEGFFSNYSSQSVSMNMSSSERKVNSLETYKSYHIEVDGNNVISMKLILDKTSLNDWANQKELDRNNLAILTEENAVLDIKSDGNYSSDIIITDNSATISVVGSAKIYDKSQLALSPDKTNCRIYWKPDSNYTTVDECEGKISIGNNFLDYNLLEIGFFLISIALVMVLSILILRYRDEKYNEGDIEEVTEQIIDGMENGDIPKDQELLLKLQEAKEKAYNNQYKEASKLLDEVESKLETDI